MWKRYLFANPVTYFVLLSQEELGKWVVPQDYDPIEAEAAHLIYEADSNKVCLVIE